MRVGFVTCVRLGLSCMEAIYDAGGKLQFVMSLRDDLAQGKSGRVYLDDFCRTHGAPLVKVRNVNDADAVAAIRNANLDWLFIIGWSQIARAEVLASSRNGVLGMHPTLLPIGRGRAPIPWAILLGLRETGVTLFRLDDGVDSGPVVAQRRVAVAPRETATTLYSKMDAAHVQLIRDAWPALASDSLEQCAQDHTAATYWEARTPAQGQLLESMRVDDADRLIRAVTHPYPGAFLETEDGVIRVWLTGPPNTPGMPDRADRQPRRLQFADGWLDATEWEREPR